jgi:hypothetical protein
MLDIEHCASDHEKPNRIEDVRGHCAAASFVAAKP